MRSLLLHAGNEEVLQDGQDGQGWAPSYHPACRVHLPAAVWRVWMAEYYGPPLKARSVSFCLHQMVLADVSVAGLCSHRPARSLIGSSRSLARGGPADGGSGSCATESGICFTLC